MGSNEEDLTLMDQHDLEPNDEINVEIWEKNTLVHKWLQASVMIKKTLNTENVVGIDRFTLNTLLE